MNRPASALGGYRGGGGTGPRPASGPNAPPQGELSAVARPGSARASRFDLSVLALVRRVPTGRVVTYGQVATLAGAPRAARAVGGAMRRCPPGVPWHRVVNGQGGISRRDSLDSVMRQRLLLEGEGVRFVRGRVDLARYRWRGAPPGAARRAASAFG